MAVNNYLTYTTLADSLEKLAQGYTVQRKTPKGKFKNVNVSFSDSAQRRISGEIRRMLADPDRLKHVTQIQKYMTVQGSTGTAYELPDQIDEEQLEKITREYEEIIANALNQKFKPTEGITRARAEKDMREAFALELTDQLKNYRSISYASIAGDEQAFKSFKGAVLQEAGDMRGSVYFDTQRQRLMHPEGMMGTTTYGRGNSPKRMDFANAVKRRHLPKAQQVIQEKQDKIDLARQLERAEGVADIYGRLVDADQLGMSGVQYLAMERRQQENFDRQVTQAYAQNNYAKLPLEVRENMAEATFNKQRAKMEATPGGIMHATQAYNDEQRSADPAWQDIGMARYVATFGPPSGKEATLMPPWFQNQVRAFRTLDKQQAMLDDPEQMRELEEMKLRMSLERDEIQDAFWTTGEGARTERGKHYQKQKQEREDDEEMEAGMGRFGNKRMARMLRKFGMAPGKAGKVAGVFGKIAIAGLILSFLIKAFQKLYEVLDKINKAIVKMGSDASARHVDSLSGGVSLADTRMYEQFRDFSKSKGNMVDMIKSNQVVARQLGNLTTDGGTGLSDAARGLAMMYSAAGLNGEQALLEAVNFALKTKNHEDVSRLTSTAMLGGLMGIAEKKSLFANKEEGDAAANALLNEYAAYLDANFKGAGLGDNLRSMWAMMQDRDGSVIMAEILAQKAAIASGAVDPRDVFRTAVTSFLPASAAALNARSDTDEAALRNVADAAIAWNTALDTLFSNLKHNLNLAFGPWLVNMMQGFQRFMLGFLTGPIGRIFFKDANAALRQDVLAINAETAAGFDRLQLHNTAVAASDRERARQILVEAGINIPADRDPTDYINQMAERYSGRNWWRNVGNLGLKGIMPNDINLTNNEQVQAFHTAMALVTRAENLIRIQNPLLEKGSEAAHKANNLYSTRLLATASPDYVGSRMNTRVNTRTFNQMPDHVRTLMELMLIWDAPDTQYGFSILDSRQGAFKPDGSLSNYLENDLLGFVTGDSDEERNERRNMLRALIEQFRVQATADKTAGRPVMTMGELDREIYRFILEHQFSANLAEFTDSLLYVLDNAEDLKSPGALNRWVSAQTRGVQLNVGAVLRESATSVVGDPALTTAVAGDKTARDLSAIPSPAIDIIPGISRGTTENVLGGLTITIPPQKIEIQPADLKIILENAEIVGAEAPPRIPVTGADISVGEARR